MNEKILQLLSFLSRLEQASQARRKVLNNYYDYDPGKIFKELDIENKGYIDYENIALFLNNHNVPYTEESLKLLIIFYDSNFDGVLSFQEFIFLIQNDNILLSNKKIIQNPNNISFNIEYCLTKLLEKEIEFNQYIINIMKQINQNIGNLSDIFNGISLNKNYITKEDIINYLDNNKIDYIESQIYDIMKRLDLNKDGKIDYNEFDYLFGLANSNNNIKNSNLNLRMKPIEDYNNNNNENLSKDYDITINGKNNNNEEINKNEYNEEFYMNNKKLFKNSSLNKNHKYCIHCIRLPCYNCKCYQNQINGNLIENWENNFYLNNNWKYSKYKKDIENSENNDDIQNKINNLIYQSNENFQNLQSNNIFKDNINKNEERFNNKYNTENENFFTNNIITYNNNYSKLNYNNKNNSYIDDHYNNNYSHYNNNYISNNNSNNNLKNNLSNKYFSPLRKEEISNSLSLRTSPIRKYPPKSKYNSKNINNNNNINNNSSYYINQK